MMTHRASLGLFLLLAVGLGVNAAFLQDELPLTVVVTTPLQLVADGNDAVQLSGTQAIQVVFSRPVIALGSDFGAEDNYGDKVPFTLSCNSSGSFRWVTTTIGRFDPTAGWPTDLACTFAWNKDLTTYDGVPLALSSPGQKSLWTALLTMSSGSVESPGVMNLTDSTWDANTGLPDDKLPEVPPDGSMQLSFSWPVNLALLQDQLELAPSDGSGSAVPVVVLPCEVKRPPIFWDIGAALKQVSQSANLASRNTMCAMVAAGDAGLDVDRQYTLTLPAGSNYSAAAGLLTKALTVKFAGLRRFRVPFRTDFGKRKASWDQPVYSGVSSRRLDLWLPHGLAPTTSVDDLKAQIGLCTYEDPYTIDADCGKLDFTAAAVSKGVVRLTVPNLKPSARHRASVLSSSSVKDGYNLSLVGGGVDFWSLDLPSIMSGPSLPMGGNVVLAEPEAQLTSWPYVVRGDPSTSNARTVASWVIDASSDADLAKVVQMASNNNWGTYVPGLLGSPENTYSVPTKADAFQLNVSLTDGSTTGGSSLSVVHTCCSHITWPTTRDASTMVNIVSRTHLSALFVTSGLNITAWVTTTAVGASGPVAGATVRLYLVPYNNDGTEKKATIKGTCTTAADGTCTLTSPVDINAPQSPGVGYFNNGAVVGLVLSGGDVLLVPNVMAGASTLNQQYQGTLVLDRLVVKPGDELHVTGFVQYQSGAVLQLPSDLQNISLTVSPSFNASAAANGGQGSSPPLVVSVNATSGSFHAVLPVPASANGGQYSLTASTGVKGDSGSGNVPQPLAVSSGSARRLMSAPFATKMVGDAMVSSVSSMPSPGYAPNALTSIAFTVADPRPPTADLVLTLPDWVTPGSKVTASVKAVSYIGAEVGGAVMALTWNVGQSSGNESITTDATGAASVVIDLGLLTGDNATHSGDALQVQVNWVGPTRELLVESASVTIQDAAYTVWVSQTLDTALPGDAFGVTASVTSSADGLAVDGAEVTVTLAPNGTASAGACSQVQTCTVVAGAANDCQLHLPCTGYYKLQACVAVPTAVRGGGGSSACGSIVLGLNDTEWALKPWAGQNEPSLTADKDSYVIGNTATLRFQNNWPDASARVLWGNAVATQQKSLPGKLARGIAEVSVPLGPECVGGCTVMVLLAVPRVASQPGTWPPTPAVPTSQLFDPLGPHTHTLQLFLSVSEARSLDVAIAVAGGSGGAATAADGSSSVVVAPGDATTVTVTVEYQGAAVEDAEVTLLAVDKSILDLLPYPLPTLVNEIQLRLDAYLGTASVDSQRVAPGAVQAAFEAVLRRLGIDPYLPADTTVQSTRWSTAAVDVSDEDYLANYHSDLTFMPSRYSMYSNGGFLPMSMAGGGGVASGIAMSSAMPVADAAMAESAARDSMGRAGGGQSGPPSVGAAPGGASGAGSASLRQQSDFEVTPLFTVLTTSSDGKGSATFDAPVNLGTYTLRAFAVSGATARYGSGEIDMVVRRTISLTPSMPRFARVGDNFTSGVIVTVAGAGGAAVAVTVTLQMGSGAAGVLLATSGSDTQVVNFAAGETQKEVRFNFSAVGVGAANATFKASDGSGAGDAVEIDLDVQGQQNPVSVATSFAIRANSSAAKQWAEGLQLPAAVPGSGAVELTAAVGHLAAIQALAQGVAAGRKQYDAPNAYSAVALAALPSVLAAYNLTVPPTLAGDVTQAYSDLKTLLDPTYGLLYSLPGQWAGWQVTRADVTLNAWAAWVVSLGTGLPQTSTYHSQWSDTVALAEQWKAAAQRQLVADANEARSGTHYPPAPYNDMDTLAWVRLTAGAEWAPSVCGQGSPAPACASSQQVVDDLSLERLAGSATSTPGWLGSEVLAALVLQSVASSSASSQVKGNATEVVAAVEQVVQSSVRVTARTAYMAYGVGDSGPASLESQALALLLLQRSGTNNQLVQKLSAYVSGQKKSGSVSLYGLLPPPVSPSPFAVAIAMAALRTYDEASGSATPDLTLNVSVGPQSLFKASFTPTTLTPVSTSTPWQALPSPPGTLLFSTSGVGEVGVAASLLFVPAQVLEFPTYRGIFVERLIQVSDAPSGSVTAVPLGAIVTITVQITSPDQLGAVTLQALMPAGLEPLDPNVNAGATQSCGMGLLDPSLSSWFLRSWWWPLCPAQMTMPSVVTFQFSGLMAGSSSMSFQAVAATSGTFVLPPVQAWAVQQPEVMGMTAGGSFTVCASSTDCSSSSAETTVPVSCPNNCSGAGVCNLAEGVCLCDSGFKGDDCGAISRRKKRSVKRSPGSAHHPRPPRARPPSSKTAGR